MAGVAARPVVFFGKIITSDLPKVVRVCLDKYMRDTRLNMYFKEKNEVYAYDKSKKCNEGDYVTIKEIPESETFYASVGNKVIYQVDKLVYKFGCTVDPITGKRCAGNEYIDDIRKTTELCNNNRPYFNVGENSEIEK